MPAARKLPTVSVGIPAYNEAANIAELLRALLNQREDGFVLQEIIVISDGSTDATPEIARTFKDARIAVLEQPDRLGQADRQNQFFELAVGSVAVLLEADTLPTSERYLAELVAPVTSGVADLSQGLPLPLSGRNWFEQMLVSQCRHYLNSVPLNESSVVSGRGGRAFARRLYQQLRWPSQAPEDLYAAQWAKINGFKILVAAEAVIHFRVANTVADFIRQRLKVAAAKRDYRKHFKLKGAGAGDLGMLQKASCLWSFLWGEPLQAFVYLALVSFIALVAPVRARRFHYRLPVAVSTKLLSA